jgi:hypothetical protein
LHLDQKPDKHTTNSKHIPTSATLLYPKNNTPKNAVSCAFYVWDETDLGFRTMVLNACDFGTSIILALAGLISQFHPPDIHPPLNSFLRGYQRVWVIKYFI